MSWRDHAQVATQSTPSALGAPWSSHSANGLLQLTFVFSFISTDSYSVTHFVEASFTYDVWVVPLCGWGWQGLALFLCWAEFHSVKVSQVTVPLPVDAQVGCFHFLGALDKGAMSFLMQSLLVTKFVIWVSASKQFQDVHPIVNIPPHRREN